ncbi:ATP synthase subunit O, mitochondrial [Brevipalpus obovatus]|uniref:ATP synthase subunit O, mitochondrial n=1 Tax=Brevipalpus obovatus TaxID=246614 RepID=UPI003D9E6449
MANCLQVITRNLATASSAGSKMIRPPISFFGLDGKYTNALYSAASKSKKVDKVEEDLRALRDLYKNDMKFRDFLSNPMVKLPMKIQAIQEISKIMKTCDITSNLLQALAENNRLKILPTITDNFCKVMAATRGELDCTVITAKPISDQQTKKDLEAVIKKFTSKKVTISSKVDPSIMGGVVIDFGGEYYIDMSLRNKMKMYTDILKETV